MPIDPDKLLAFPIPSVRQEIRAQDAAFYALSIGLGQASGDDRQLRYCCPDRDDFAPFPTFALVTAHPGFWLGDPGSGVDPGMVLHASQSLTLMGPIPVGETVQSRSRIGRLVDKGPGKAALIDTETVLEDSGGTPFAVLSGTTFVRGGGGFGGDNLAGADLASVRDRPCNHAATDCTRPEQALLYRLNGDFNPLHSDPRVAARAGFRSPILHGLCTAGVVAGAVVRSLAGGDAARLGSMRLRFAGHVFPGETIRTEVWDDGTFLARVIERDCVVVDQGHAEIAAA